MTKFCKNCDNLLVPNFENDKLVFMCMLCRTRYASEAEDTLRYEYVKYDNVMVFEKILSKAVDDPAVMKAYVNCINDKCGGKIVKRVRIGEDMRLYNICISCRTQWLN